MLLVGSAAFAAGAFLAWTRALARMKRRERETELERVRSGAEHAESLREAKAEGLAAQQRLRDELDQRWIERQRDLEESAKRIGDRERLVNEQLDRLARLQDSVRQSESDLAKRAQELDRRQEALALMDRQRRELLEQVSQLGAGEARKQLLADVERESLGDAAELSRRIVREAKTRAEDEARRLISIAIQRYAGDQSFETTTATVALQGDDMKGRIIGKEGRNIRAFEQATGVTVLIDDTPNAVVLSSFDPVRRAIAREAMRLLILDGRIHPGRIEEVVSKVSQEMDDAILKAGEDAVARAGTKPYHPEIVQKLGRLRFRHSFTQNILDHSVEVARLAGLLAAEMGLDVELAKRTGLLHDIGKAMDHEMEGSHAAVGAAFIRRHGEPDAVVNGVAAHHDEVEHVGLYGRLASAADAMSASRPGARSETMSIYLKRLGDLEEIGKSFPGVERCFAVQAGRELRVFVQPESLGDAQAQMLARNVVRRIEEQLQYPGQIRVTVIRETRCVEFAK